MKKISELLQIQTHLYEMIYFYKNHKNQKKQTRDVFIIYTILYPREATRKEFLKNRRGTFLLFSPA